MGPFLVETKEKRGGGGRKRKKERGEYENREYVCMLVLGWLLPSPLLLHPVPAEPLGYWGGTGHIQPPASPSLETPSQAQTVGCLLILEASRPRELDKQDSPCLILPNPTSGRSGRCQISSPK